MTRTIAVHVFNDAGLPADIRDHRYCVCGLRDDHPSHELPETPAEAAELTARILGEHEEAS